MDTNKSKERKMNRRSKTYLNEKKVTRELANERETHVECELKDNGVDGEKEKKRIERESKLTDTRDKQIKKREREREREREIEEEGGGKGGGGGLMFEQGVKSFVFQSISLMHIFMSAHRATRGQSLASFHAE